MIYPTKGRVVVLRDKVEEEQTIIKLPDSKKVEPNTGTIYNTYKKTSDLDLGSRIVFGTFGMTKVIDPENNEEYLVMDEDNIIAVLVQ